MTMVVVMHCRIGRGSMLDAGLFYVEVVHYKPTSEVHTGVCAEFLKGSYFLTSPQAMPTLTGKTEVTVFSSGKNEVTVFFEESYVMIPCVLRLTEV